MGPRSRLAADDLVRPAAQLLFCIGRYPYRHSFRVLKGPPVVIIGNDLLAPLRASINPRVGNAQGCLRLPHPTAPSGWFEVPLSIEKAPPPQGLMRVENGPSKEMPPVRVITLFVEWTEKGLAIDVRRSAGGETLLLQREGPLEREALLRTLLEEEVGI